MIKSLKWTSCTIKAQFGLFPKAYVAHAYVLNSDEGLTERALETHKNAQFLKYFIY
jgi:hypothetical protein